MISTGRNTLSISTPSSVQFKMDFPRGWVTDEEVEDRSWPVPTFHVLFSFGLLFLSILWLFYTWIIPHSTGTSPLDKGSEVSPNLPSKGPGEGPLHEVHPYQTSQVQLEHEPILKLLPGVKVGGDKEPLSYGCLLTPSTTILENRGVSWRWFPNILLQSVFSNLNPVHVV